MERYFFKSESIPKIPWKIMKRTRTARALRRAVCVSLLLLLALGLRQLCRPVPSILPVTRRKVNTETRERITQTTKKKLIHSQSTVMEKNEMSTITEKADEVSRRPWFMRGGKRYLQHHNPQAKVFPEDAPGDDRIVEQLMYTLSKDKDAPVKKILLAGFDSSYVTKQFLSSNCPVPRCLFTDNTRETTTADAILFKDIYQKLKIKRNSKQIWILYNLESPYHTPGLRLLYNWTVTYRRDSDIVAPYEKFVYYHSNITESEPKRNYAANKTKKVAWFVSNCNANNQRMKYAKKLSKYIKVDIYGACSDGGAICFTGDPACSQMLDKEYKFYLSFENSNCVDYITEKFFVKGLKHDIIPIVMGARPSDYAAVAPPNSYIHVEEFQEVAELADYLNILDEEDEFYNSYFKWKGTGEFINTYFWCRLCAMLHASDQRNRTSHYPDDLEEWWRRGACTRGQWRHYGLAMKEYEKPISPPSASKLRDFVLKKVSDKRTK